MKTKHYAKPQRGFFDFGMSVLVLALAGGFIYGAESSRAEQQSIAAVQVEQDISSGVSAGNETVVAEALQ